MSDTESTTQIQEVAGNAETVDFIQDPIADSVSEVEPSLEQQNELVEKEQEEKEKEQEEKEQEKEEKEQEKEEKEQEEQEPAQEPEQEPEQEQEQEEQQPTVETEEPLQNAQVQLEKESLNEDESSQNTEKRKEEEPELDVDDIDFGFDTETKSNAEADLEEDVLKLNKFKKASNADITFPSSPLKKRARDESIDHNLEIDNNAGEIEDEQTRKRREFEEKFNALIKKPTKKRKNNDVDLESMQDEAISHLKNMMKDAAYMDIDCVNNKKPATNKLKLLPQVKETLLKSNLYDSILDNNMLEAVRIWLEPLPDASLPSFEIQKTLLNELGKLPIKTIHLRESGLGKVMIFYQKSKKVDSGLKRIAEKLIGDWTRPVMGRSDNYRAREIPTANFDVEKYRTKTKLQSSQDEANKNRVVKKSLYQESADRRKRAAAPEARTSVYTIAPQSNLASLQSQNSSVLSVGIGSSINRDERFKAINRKLTKLSQKRKAVKKDGVSIEGRGLNV